MMEAQPSAAVRAAYAGWNIGLLEIEALARGADRDHAGTELQAEVLRVEAKLRTELGGLGRKELAAKPRLEAYAEHFGRWGKAYPVLLQAEAIASKGRRLTMPLPLVTAMFVAELDGLLLMAGHDLESLRLPLTLELASGLESMPTLGGPEKALPAGDLFMRDDEGIVASVLLGPDDRTSLSAATDRALFVIYAPPTISEEAVRSQFGFLAATIAKAWPDARPSLVELLALGECGLMTDEAPAPNGKGRTGAHLFLAFGFVLAGSSVLPGKVLSGLPVFWAAASGAAIALVPLLPLAWAEARRSRASEGGSSYGTELLRALPLLAIEALFGMALFRVFMLTALSLTSAAEVGMATSATPAITALLAALFLKERIGRRGAIGIAFVVAGIAILDSGGLSSASGGAGMRAGRMLGCLLALGSAASESVFNVVAKRLPSRIGPMASSAAVTALAFAMLATLSLATGERVDPASLSPPILAAIAYQGLFASALAYVCFYRGAALLPASTIGVFSSLMPLAGLLVSVLFLGERTGARGAGGAALALAGMLLCVAGDRRPVDLAG